MISHAATTSTTPSEDIQRNLTTEGIRADATLDLRGLWCPLPPLRTVAKLRAMEPGQVLEVLGTNPVGNRVAPWVAQKLGDQLLGVVEDAEGFHRFFFRKTR